MSVEFDNKTENNEVHDEDINHLSLCIMKNQSNQPAVDENLFLFRETVKNTIEQTINSFSEETFREEFNNISVIQKKPGTALKLFEIFKKAAAERAIIQLDHWIEEDKMDDAFVAYSSLIENNRFDKKTVGWRPPGDVKLHLRSPFLIQKLKRKIDLEQYVLSKESEVLRLQNEVKMKRSKIKDIEVELREIYAKNVDTVNMIEQAIKPFLYNNFT